MLIDTHAHIYSEKLQADIEAIMARAQNANVGGIVMPNIDMASIESMENIARNYAFCHPTMGLHPCSVDETFEQILDKMEALLETGRYYGIGETGIDLFWDDTFINQQKASFDRHLAWSKIFDLPIIIHSRESIDLCIDMVTARQDGSLEGVFHCFSGDAVQAKKIKDLGFYIGIGGVVTYKNSTLPEVLKNNGLANVVLETDSPYLPPVPHRGKSNEPSFVSLVANKVCEIFDNKKEEIETILEANSRKLFRKVSF